MSQAQGNRVLVTGGAGFIGHRLVSILLDRGDRVAVLDNLSSGIPMPEERPNLTTVVGDLCDSAALDALFADFEPRCVVHLAAVHHIPTCERRRAFSLDVNIVGTEILLEAAERHRVGTVLLASSGAVYDWLDGPLREDSPTRPRDNYALAKWTNEAQLAFWSARTGGRARVARIFNAIGHDDPNGHLVPDILHQIPVGADSAVIQVGNIAPKRDYVHADDIAAGLAAVLDDPRTEVPFDVFNLCSGKEASVAELAELIGRVMGVRVVVEQAAGRMRRVDRLRQLGDGGKARSLLDWHPRRPLLEALEDIARRIREDERGRVGLPASR